LPHPGVSDTGQVTQELESSHDEVI
jgi:hypothetical protein